MQRAAQENQECPYVQYLAYNVSVLLQQCCTGPGMNVFFFCVAACTC